MHTSQNETEVNPTVGYYERHAEAFAHDTAKADVSEILGRFTALLPAGASVLDWGCGTGRDTRTMLDGGLVVTSADASEAMCAVAKETFGVEPACEGFEDLDAVCEYDGIWACASLLHVEKRKLPAVLNRAYDALKENGVLYMSFKYGGFEGMRGGRWYTDLDEAALAELAGSGFEIVETWVTGDVRPGRAEERWLNCLLRKR